MEREHCYLIEDDEVALEPGGIEDCMNRARMFLLHVGAVQKALYMFWYTVKALTEISENMVSPTARWRLPLAFCFMNSEGKMDISSRKD